jgi:hypothetical protein
MPEHTTLSKDSGKPSRESGGFVYSVSFISSGKG